MAKGVSPKIYFNYLIKPFYFPNRNFVKQFLASQFDAHNRKIQKVNYIFCSDDYLLVINQTYLNHNTYTDIITFELSSKEQSLLTDIYISVDRVKDNAKKFRVSFTNELHRVIFHGALHLIGYNDKSNRQAQRMKEKEDEWLRLYFVSRGKQ